MSSSFSFSIITLRCPHFTRAQPTIQTCPQSMVQTIANPHPAAHSTHSCCLQSHATLPHRESDLTMTWTVIDWAHHHPENVVVLAMGDALGGTPANAQHRPCRLTMRTVLTISRLLGSHPLGITACPQHGQRSLHMHIKISRLTIVMFTLQPLNRRPFLTQATGALAAAGWSSRQDRGTPGAAVRVDSSLHPS